MGFANSLALLQQLLDSLQQKESFNIYNLPCPHDTLTKSLILKVLDFWFTSDTTKADYVHDARLWFFGGDELDEKIKREFEGMLQAAARGEYEHWSQSPEGTLALVILLDQFSRNMYRGTPNMFVFDKQAIEIASRAVNDRLDLKLSDAHRFFLYVALEHSEDMETVIRSVDLMEALVENSSPTQRHRFQQYFRVAKNHYDMLKKFKRYPHRNEILGRPNTPEENSFLTDGKHNWRFINSVRKSPTPTMNVRPGREAKKEAQQTRSKKKTGGSIKKAIVDKKKLKLAAREKQLSKQLAAAGSGTVGKRKLRIVLLHSFRQNGAVLQSRTARLRKALSPIADIVYANSPHHYIAKDENKEAYIKAFGTQPPQSHQRIWFNSNPDNTVYSGLDESIDYLSQLNRTHGPFDGMFAFSQGGALAGIICALRQQDFQLKFVIMVSGFLARAPSIQAHLQPNSVKLPSLHIIGQRDLLVDPSRSQALAECFDSASREVVEHPGGHFVPKLWPDNKIFEFVSRFVNNSEPDNTPVVTAAPAASVTVETITQMASNSLASPLLLSLDAWQSVLAPALASPLGGVFGKVGRSEFEALVEQALKLESQVPVETIVEDLTVLAFFIRLYTKRLIGGRPIKRGKMFNMAPVFDAVLYIPLLLLAARPDTLPLLLPIVKDIPNKEGCEWGDLCQLLDLAVSKEESEEEEGEHPFVEAVVSTFAHRLAEDHRLVMVSQARAQAQQAARSKPTKAEQEDISDLAELVAEKKGDDEEEGGRGEDGNDDYGEVADNMGQGDGHADGEEGDAEAGLMAEISHAAFFAPRLQGSLDRRCRAARRIARTLNPLHTPSPLAIEHARQAQERGETGASTDPESYTKGICYDRYRRLVVLLNKILDKSNPDRMESEMQKQREDLRKAKLYNRERWEKFLQANVSGAVIHPEPEPVFPCPLSELDPLLEYMRSSNPVTEKTSFPRGTLMPDGRLDLCKQVVGPRGIGPVLDAMAKTSVVSRLLLGNNIVENSGALLIADFIRTKKEQSPLDCWYIAGNRFDKDGVAPICDVLRDDTKVTSLWLKRNPLKPAGIVPIADLLRYNRTLVTLDLVNTGMLDEGVKIIFEGMLHNSTLKHLYIGTNGVTELGARYCGEYLGSGKGTLETIFLSCNRLADAGVKHIADGLLHDKSLKRLGLSSNRIGSQGAIDLCEAVKDHPSLELIDLGFSRATVAVGELGNRISDIGAKAVSELIAANPRIRSLDLMNNSIGQIGVNFLRSALENNTTLTTLTLTQFGKVHNEIAREHIKALLERNKKLYPGDPLDLVRIDVPDHINEVYSVYRTK